MAVVGGEKSIVILATLIFAVILLLLFFQPAESNNLNQLSVCEIQGDGYYSVYADQYVQTEGLVHADMDETWRKGFFIQQEDCDDNPQTSDGIFVYTGEENNLVSPGDQVIVTGTVKEYLGLTEISTKPISITLVTSGNPLPSVVDLNPPFDNKAAEMYYESLEGMRVSLEEGITVGPTDNYDRSWIIIGDLGIERVFQDDPQGTGEIILVDDTGPEEISPDVKVGDKIINLTGVMDYVFDDYRMSLFSEPQVVIQSPRGLQNDYSVSTQKSSPIAVATFNLWNMFDAEDDPETEDAIHSTTEYQRRLHKRALAIHHELNEPEVLAVQEVENLEVLQDLTSQPEIQSEYGIVWIDSIDRRGLDSALLYRKDRVRVSEYESRQGCTDLQDGLGPDGNNDVDNPFNELTCDQNGDGNFDGNRLFSRPPLVIETLVGKMPEENQLEIADNSQAVPIWFIVNHWKSKYEDTENYPYTLLRRLEQSQFVNTLVFEILKGNPQANIIVLGDFNDYIDSYPIKNLSANGLTNLLGLPDRNERYTYIYQGVSQVLDHILVKTGPNLSIRKISPVHINADYPYSYKSNTETVHRSSDHDPVLVDFIYYEEEIYLPLIQNQN